MISVGIGEAEIIFPQQIFPNPRERYTGVHDAPLIHVLVLRSAERFAFAFCDLVDPGDWGELRRALAAATATPLENTVLHTSHVLSTPHCAREYADDTERENDRLLRAAIKDALIAAAETAALDMEPAVPGFSMAECGINVNRVLETADGFAEGTNPEGETDHSVPVFCFKKINGDLKAVIYAVNCAAGVLEGSFLPDGKRLVSGDIASASSRLLRERLGVHAVYAAGATGDQWQALRAVADRLDESGRLIKEDRGMEGFVYVETLAGRLAGAVTAVVKSAEYDEESELKLFHRRISLPGHKRLPPSEVRKITRHAAFEPGPDIEMEYLVLCTGNTAVIGCMPEVCVSSLRRIREASPFRYTALLEFINGSADYMVTRELYEKCTPQSRKGCFAPGAAELFERDVSAFLKEIYG